MKIICKYSVIHLWQNANSYCLSVIYICICMYIWDALFFSDRERDRIEALDILCTRNKNNEKNSVRILCRHSFHKVTIKSIILYFIIKNCFKVPFQSLLHYFCFLILKRAQLRTIICQRYMFRCMCIIKIWKVHTYIYMKI